LTICVTWLSIHWDPNVMPSLLMVGHRHSRAQLIPTH
jgi:hypothetical protein